MNKLYLNEALSAPLNIVIVATNAPPLIGGLEKLCLRIAQNAIQQGHSAKIVARFTDSRQSLRAYFSVSQSKKFFVHESVVIESICLGFFSKLLLSPVFKLIWRKFTFPVAKWLYVCAVSPSLLSACRGADIIHFFGSGCEMLGFAAVEVAGRLNIPLIIEPALHEGSWGDKWQDSLLYRLGSFVIAHSHYEAALLCRLGVSSANITCVTHGADVRCSGNSDRFRQAYKISGPIVLFLGRKTVEKGLLRTLNAWCIVHSVMPGAVLVLAGPALDPMLGPRLDVDITSSRSSTGILNLDNLSDQLKHDVLAACDVLCVPSEGESFGMVYIEACAYGKPFVALQLPVLEETIGISQAGLLVADSPPDIANAILQLLQSEEYRHIMGEHGRALARKHSWSFAIRDYIRCYQALAS